jgi:predicted methyltransferase MtxX (methanogen marker protein 4)
VPAHGDVPAGPVHLAAHGAEVVLYLLQELGMKMDCRASLAMTTWILRHASEARQSMSFFLNAINIEKIGVIQFKKIQIVYI